MATGGVVEAVDVLADGHCRRGSALEVVGVVHLALERGEEALGDGIVPAVALPAHAALDASGLEGLPVVVAGVRAASIGVVDEVLGGTALGEGDVQCLEREVTVDVFAGRPPDDPPREEVEDGGQVEPPLLRPQEREYPFGESRS